VVNAFTRQNGPLYFNHPLIKKDCIEFRVYQNNISESARNTNTLIILPTALGKTVIAILVCAEFLYNYKSKRVLIMAPTKPLVAQHMNSFFSGLRMLCSTIIASCYSSYDCQPGIRKKKNPGSM
jgi:ERCC4-related helicase